MSLSTLSRRRLRGVHPALVRVVERACELEGPQILVVEGLRTKQRQAAFMAAGVSWTMNSRHLTGHAVDLCVLVDGVARWDWPCFWPLADRMRQAAKEEGVEIVWGGTWAGKKRDGPHFQLSWTKYPVAAPPPATGRRAA